MNRDFKGVWIPKEIWLDKRLNALEKVILAEIDSLSTSEEGCYASNQYLAEFCGCSATKVSEAISKLISFRLLELVSFDGRTRFLKSNVSQFREGSLTESVRQTHRKLKADSQNLEAININNNIKDYSKREYREKATRFTRPTLDEVKQYIYDNGYAVDAERFISYYDSNGWKVGRNPMKDWKAAVRTWNNKEKPKVSFSEPKKNTFNDFEQRTYDFDDLEMKLMSKLHGRDLTKG